MYLTVNEHGAPGDSADRNVTAHHFLLRVRHGAATHFRVAVALPCPKPWQLSLLVTQARTLFGRLERNEGGRQMGF